MARSMSATRSVSGPRGAGEGAGENVCGHGQLLAVAGMIPEGSLSLAGSSLGGFRIAG